MCDIFPDIQNCCLCISLRLGLLLISILSIMSGVTLLCIVEQRTGASFDTLKNVSDIDAPTKVMAGLGTIIPTGLSGMSVIFMFVGVVLLFAIVADQEGLVQIFVWVTFLNIIIGFVLVIAVTFQCVRGQTCMLEGMDWLTASAMLVAVVAYLFLWLYFVMVGSSFVNNEFF